MIVEQDLPDETYVRQDSITVVQVRNSEKL